MSKCSINQVMMRIKGSDASSQIAVFRCEEPEKLDAVFASTVKTRSMIVQRQPGLIGVYDGTMNLDQVSRELAGHVRLRHNHK